MIRIAGQDFYTPAELAGLAGMKSHAIIMRLQRGSLKHTTIPAPRRVIGRKAAEDLLREQGKDPALLNTLAVESTADALSSVMLADRGELLKALKTIGLNNRQIDEVIRLSEVLPETDADEDGEDE